MQTGPTIFDRDFKAAGNAGETLKEQKRFVAEYPVDTPQGSWMKLLYFPMNLTFSDYADLPLVNYKRVKELRQKFIEIYRERFDKNLFCERKEKLKVWWPDGQKLPWVVVVDDKGNEHSVKGYSAGDFLNMRIESNRTLMGATDTLLCICIYCLYPARMERLFKEEHKQEYQDDVTAL